MKLAVLTPVFVLSLASPMFAGTLNVGPGQTFSKPCQAFAVAAPGDTILIDAAGIYTGDVCVS